MLSIGINALYHDTSVALVEDGQVIAAVRKNVFLESSIILEY